MASRKKSRSTRNARPRVRPKAAGRLVIIGGHEEKEGDREILKEVSALVKPGPLVVATVASHQNSDALWKDYQRVFRGLGIRKLRHLRIDERRDSFSQENIDVFNGARGVFFTGGDQLKITGQFGGTPACDAMRDVVANGGTIIGTSAGASVMATTMLISGRSSASPRVDETVKLGPGLGLLENAIIDQHFAERGRIGRLLGAVALNPAALGIGIDEDTAIVVENDTHFRVTGRGAVYVVDGRGIVDSNLDDGQRGDVLSIFGVRLHVLSNGDTFDLRKRKPTRA